VIAVFAVEDPAVKILVARIVQAVLLDWIWHLAVAMMAVAAVENSVALARRWNSSVRGVLFRVVIEAVVFDSGGCVCVISIGGVSIHS